MSGIYVHIPFCRHKCIYCDFYSVGARRAPWERLAAAIVREARLRSAEVCGSVRTLYIGGGTPSAMPAELLADMCVRLRELFAEKIQLEEFTVEVNPDDVTEEFAESLLQTGVNRVSMGVQSFHDEELRAIGRRHTAAQAVRACSILSQIGNLGIDLIFGLPGQTLSSWADNVARAIELRPQHISAYALMWEPGTPLDIMRRQQRVCEVPDTTSAQMYEVLRRELSDAGYEHYEISNYALPGYRSRHNSSYWAGAPYLGLGPGAHSYDGRYLRRANPADIDGYLEYYSGSECASETFFEDECLTDNDLREEYIMTRLRTAAGLSIDDFKTRFGRRESEALLKKAGPHIAARRLISSADGRLYIEPGSMLVSDSVIVDLF